jgi:hypothetical protein
VVYPAVEPDMPRATLTVDERAAARAYLQRAEVRLSTMHRVATALLSGAGLMVLLPAVERDSVVQVVRSLLVGEPSTVHLLLVVSVAAALAVPFAALWFVLRDLTQFYFHANHVRHARGEAFTPRFTLTGLRLPAGELGSDSAGALDDARRHPNAVELLVPANDQARRRIDARIDSYGGLGADADGIDDTTRAAALFELAASRERSLLDEIAKVEHGMARHVLRTQTIVLRYVKALLALLTTALAAFAAAGVVEGKAVLTTGDESWLAVIFMLWAPLVVVAVSAPVRWLDSQLRNEVATHAAVANDRELTRVERVTVALALAGFTTALAAMAICFGRDDLPDAGRRVAAVATVLAAAALGAVLRVRRRTGRPAAPTAR